MLWYLDFQFHLKEKADVDLFINLVSLRTTYFSFTGSEEIFPKSDTSVLEDEGHGPSGASVTSYDMV